MPEPNLPPLRLCLHENVAESNLVNVPLLRRQIPELPSDFRNKFLNEFNLPLDYVLRLLVSMDE